jgi:hypothetical protein
VVIVHARTAVAASFQRRIRERTFGFSGESITFAAVDVAKFLPSARASRAQETKFR